jgi:replicative DNA helicase
MDRAPAIDPRNDERFTTEMELLGALMNAREPAAWHEAAAVVDWSEFNDHFCGRVFAKIGEGVKQGLVSFPLTRWLIDQFEGDATLAEIGLTARKFCAQCLALAAPAVAISGYARQIKHEFLADMLAVAVSDGDTDAAQSFAAEMERLKRAHMDKDDGLQLIEAAADKIVNRLQEAIAEGVLREDTASPGSFALSNVIGGWRRGRMYVIGGRPGQGKTTTALSLLLKTARKGHGVMFFELEMGADELTEMALCDLAWSRTNRIEYRDLSGPKVADPAFDRKFEAIVEARRNFERMPFLISDRPGLTINDIRAQAAQYAQRLAAQGKRLDVICVDHLNLIKASANYRGNKVAETEEVSNSLKALAKELQCAVVVLAQLNRQVEGREERRPGLSDLRWTGAIEQDADVVMFVYREAYYLSKPIDDPVKDDERRHKLAQCQNKLEIVFAKHRGGPTPTVEMFCDMGCAVVRDLTS